MWSDGQKKEDYSRMGSFNRKVTNDLRIHRRVAVMILSPLILRFCGTPLTAKDLYSRSAAESITALVEALGDETVSGNDPDISAKVTAG